MLQLRKSAEARLEDLKSELGSVESELEDARSAASVGGQMGKLSEEVREKERELTSKSQSTKQIKEKAASMAEIEQRVVSGLSHLGEMLGIPARQDDNVPISDLLRDIDAILETLIDELEKQQPQNMSSTAENSSSRVLARDTNPAVSLLFLFVFTRSLSFVMFFS